MTPEMMRCSCDPCTLPRAKGGRCPSTDLETSPGVLSSHCIPCAFMCFEDDDSDKETATT